MSKQITLLLILFVMASVFIAKTIEAKHDEYIKEQLADRTLNLYSEGVYVRAYDFKTKKEIWIESPACEIARIIKKGE